MDLKKAQELRNYGNSFTGDVCAECKEKILDYIKEHKAQMVLRPKKMQTKLAGLLCPTCKMNIIRKLKRR